jgi:hypothetical protein
MLKTIRPSALSGGMDYCANVSGGANAPGKPVILWRCSNDTNEQFSLDVSGQLHVFNSSTCVGTSDGKSASGSHIVIKPCNGGTDQKWSYNSISGLFSTSNGQCLDVGSKTLSGSPQLRLFDCGSHKPTQIFSFNNVNSNVLN